MHDIVHELDIQAPPEQVFTAVTSPVGLASWWAASVPDAEADGAELRATFADGTEVRLRADTVEPPVLAHLTCVDGPEEWPGTQLAFRIEGRGGGSVLRFWHGGWEYEDGSLPRASFQWALALDRLRRYLETGEGSPAP